MLKSVSVCEQGLDLKWRGEWRETAIRPGQESSPIVSVVKTFNPGPAW